MWTRLSSFAGVLLMIGITLGVSACSDSPSFSKDPQEGDSADAPVPPASSSGSTEDPPLPPGSSSGGGSSGSSSGGEAPPDDSEPEPCREGRITICHVPPGNPSARHTITCMPIKAATNPGHAVRFDGEPGGHGGDTPGACAP